MKNRGKDNKERAEFNRDINTNEHIEKEEEGYQWGIIYANFWISNYEHEWGEKNQENLV